MKYSGNKANKSYAKTQNNRKNESWAGSHKRRKWFPMLDHNTGGAEESMVVGLASLE